MSTRQTIGILGLIICLIFLGCDSDSPTAPSTPTGPSKNYNGNWKGSTSTGGSVRFKVADNMVSELFLEHKSRTIFGVCIVTLTNTYNVSISGDSFKFKHKKSISEHGVIEGTFTSETTCSGKYDFSTGKFGLCPPFTVKGTFDANRQ